VINLKSVKPVMLLAVVTILKNHLFLNPSKRNVVLKRI